MNILEKAKEAAEKLQNLINDSQNNLEFNANIILSEEQSLVFQLIKTLTKTLDDTLTDNDIINMIFRNGLYYELEKIKDSKSEIYNMGNLELLADENNINLSKEEREIAAIQAPQTIDEYWKLGYITIVCPQCQSRAVWDEKTTIYHCLDGCRKTGTMNQK